MCTQWHSMQRTDHSNRDPLEYYNRRLDKIDYIDMNNCPRCWCIDHYFYINHGPMHIHQCPRCKSADERNLSDKSMFDCSDTVTLHTVEQASNRSVRWNLVNKCKWNLWPYSHRCPDFHRVAKGNSWFSSDRIDPCNPDSRCSWTNWNWPTTDRCRSDTENIDKDFDWFRRMCLCREEWNIDICIQSTLTNTMHCFDKHCLHMDQWKFHKDVLWITWHIGRRNLSLSGESAYPCRMLGNSRFRWNTNHRCDNRWKPDIRCRRSARWSSAGTFDSDPNRPDTLFRLENCSRNVPRHKSSGRCIERCSSVRRTSAGRFVSLDRLSPCT